MTAMIADSCIILVIIIIVLTHFALTQSSSPGVKIKVVGPPISITKWRCVTKGGI